MAFITNVATGSACFGNAFYLVPFLNLPRVLLRCEQYTMGNPTTPSASEENNQRQPQLQRSFTERGPWVSSHMTHLFWIKQIDQSHLQTKGQSPVTQQFHPMATACFGDPVSCLCLLSCRSICSSPPEYIGSCPLWASSQICLHFSFGVV